MSGKNPLPLYDFATQKVELPGKIIYVLNCPLLKVEEESVFVQ